MALNPYLSHRVTSEQDLYADLIIESIKSFGEDVYYLPRDVVNVDYVLNEDIESRFDSSYLVEMYIENTEGFEGEGNLLAKFGLEIRDEATFVVAKRTWNSLVGGLENQVRPMEGDLIYLPLSKSFFEISFVEHEQPFYQLSNLPIYKLQARLFEYSDEEFDTGVTEIDAITTGAQGMIATQEDVQVFANTNTATAVTSEPTTTTTQNYTVEYEADSIVDFSESNPFGEI
jgi:hypothetical protein